MAGIELLNILKVMYEVIGDQNESRTLDLQTIETSNSPGDLQNKTYSVDAHHNNANMPHYLTSSTNRAADWKASNIFTKEIHNEFSNAFSGIGCFEVTFSRGEGWQLTVPGGSSQGYHMYHRNPFKRS